MHCPINTKSSPLERTSACKFKYAFSSIYLSEYIVSNFWHVKVFLIFPPLNDLCFFVAVVLNQQCVPLASYYGNTHKTLLVGQRQMVISKAFKQKHKIKRQIIGEKCILYNSRSCYIQMDTHTFHHFVSYFFSIRVKY